MTYDSIPVKEDKKRTMHEIRSYDFPFFIGNNRAMVSLGPLSPTRYCTYACKFCYVQADFKSYAKLEIPDIIKFLDKNRNNFDIIYISGDTDSFAPPRTKEGINLMQTISKNFDSDLMFTTRAIFSDDELQMIKEVQETLADKEKFLFGCESITHLRTAEETEPKPIPSPEQRITMLQKYKNLGLVSVLAMRPFLPMVPVSEYVELVSLCKDFIDIVLGEVLYLDPKGIIGKQLFTSGIPTNIGLVDHKMDFDDNTAIWKTWEGKDIENGVQNYCNSMRIPFFMRSRPAVEFIRNKGFDFITERMTRKRMPDH